jgi:hypothetical protein
MASKDYEQLSVSEMRDAMFSKSTGAIYESYSDAEITAFFRIASEYAKALRKHKKGFNSTHEGYGVVLEELDEAWDEIKADDIPASCDEMAQVGAMAMRYLVDLSE